MTLIQWLASSLSLAAIGYGAGILHSAPAIQRLTDAQESVRVDLVECVSERDSAYEGRALAAQAFDSCVEDEKEARGRLLRALWQYDKVRVHCNEPDDCWEMR